MSVYYLALWVGGFIITFVVGYVFLLLARTEKRAASTAILFRTTAVLAAALFAYAASFDGLNAGSIIAALAITGMSIFRRERQ